MNKNITLTTEGLISIEDFNPLNFVEIAEDGYKFISYPTLKYWFRKIYPKGKIETEIVTFDEKKAVVRATIYENTKTPEDEFLATYFGSSFYDPTDEDYGDSYLGRAMAKAVSGCFELIGLVYPNKEFTHPSNYNQGKDKTSFEPVIEEKNLIKEKNLIEDIKTSNDSIDIENHPPLKPNQSLENESSVKKEDKEFLKEFAREPEEIIAVNNPVVEIIDAEESINEDVSSDGEPKEEIIIEESMIKEITDNPVIETIDEKSIEEDVSSDAEPKENKLGFNDPFSLSNDNENKIVTIECEDDSQKVTEYNIISLVSKIDNVNDIDKLLPIEVIEKLLSPDEALQVVIDEYLFKDSPSTFETLRDNFGSDFNSVLRYFISPQNKGESNLIRAAAKVLLAN